jgi:ABC-type nitrate/sulfonate/bicarbonate transport system permease component
MNFHRYIGIAGALALWYAIVAMQVFDAFFFPSPLETFSAVVRLFHEHLFTDLLATLGRTFFAFSIALVTAVPLGLALGRMERVYRAIEPLVDFLRSMPATAMFPFFMLLLGVGEGSKIAVASSGAFFIILFNTAYGVMHCGKSRSLAAKLMGASSWQIFRTITFWESLPQTFIGLRNGISLTLAIIVVTEMFIGTDVGLGRRIIDSQIVFDIPAMFAALLATGTLGYALNHLLLIIERRFVHWTKE